MLNKVITVTLFVVLKLVHGQNPVPPNQELESNIFFDTSDIASGAYSFRFRTSDNTVREESGGFDNDENYVVNGLYSYVDDAGQMYYVQYTADKDGYHPRKGGRRPGNRITTANILAWINNIKVELPPAAGYRGTLTEIGKSLIGG